MSEVQYDCNVRVENNPPEGSFLWFGRLRLEIAPSQTAKAKVKGSREREKKGEILLLYTGGKQKNVFSDFQFFIKLFY